MDSQKINPVEQFYENKLKRKLSEANIAVDQVAKPSKKRKKSLASDSTPKIVHGFVSF